MRAPALARAPEFYGVRDPVKELVELSQRWQITGRGGAGFPFWKKLSAVSDNTSIFSRPFVVVNLTESEPLSFKDRFIKTYYLELVLEGAVLASKALRAEAIYVASHYEKGESDALSDYVKGYAAARGVKIETVAMRKALVSGQETSIVNAINGRVPLPRVQPPRLSEKGVKSRPTLLSNAETYLRVAQAKRLESICDHVDPKMTLGYLGTIHLKTGESYIVESHPLMSVAEIMGSLGAPLNESSLYLVGGYFGRLFQGKDARLYAPISRSKREGGAGWGAGLVVELERQGCVAAELGFLIRWLSLQSAGQCGPCKFGLPQISNEFDNMVTQATGSIELIRRWKGQIKGRGGCALPDSVCDLESSFEEVTLEELSLHQAGNCDRAYERIFEGLHMSFYGKVDPYGG
jgi:NADH:ubiquinone oxidoreductase subunit F (NADH-binding)